MKRGFLFVGVLLVVAPETVCGMSSSKAVLDLVAKVAKEEINEKNSGFLARNSPLMRAVLEEDRVAIDPVNVFRQVVIKFAETRSYYVWSIFKQVNTLFDLWRAGDKAAVAAQVAATIASAEVEKYLDVSEWLRLDKDFSWALIQPFIHTVSQNFVTQINAPDFQERIKNVTRFLGHEGDLWQLPLFVNTRNLLGYTGSVNSAVFSPDGKQVITASWDRTAKIWDVATGTCAQTFTGHTASVFSAVFSPDAKQAITASADRTAKIWDVATGTCDKTLTGHTDMVCSAGFSPDGSLVVTASYDGTVKIWNVALGNLAQTLQGHTGLVRSAAFSPDGSKIVTASYDHTAKIWAVATGKCLKTFTGHTSIVQSAVFSPDGSRVVTASWDETVKIWDVARGALVKTFTDEDEIRPIFDKDYVHSAVFSIDGRRVVSASNYGTAKIWDAATGNLVQTLMGHTHSVYSVAFSQDGSKIVTASGDGTAKIWDGLSVSAAEKVLYEAFVLSGLKKLEDHQITNPDALKLIQKLNRRFTPGGEPIPIVLKFAEPMEEDFSL